MGVSQKTTHNIVSFGALLLIAVFGVWWFSFQHVPHNFHGSTHLFDFALFALLSYVIWHPIAMEMLSWAITSYIKDPVPQVPAKNLKVAFLTTFVPQSESIELLEKTLPAMVAVNYEHDTWVLDEGNDPRVRELCARVGAFHFSRSGHDYFNTEGGKYSRKTKGGNHNSWYDSYGDNYEIVAQMDTDFVPEPEYLEKTLGYFNDPKVAFVGTPQIYANTEESLIARGAAQQTYNFYGPILRGLFGMDTTLLIGANHVIRVAALKEVDHYSAHITEDLLTGMKLHSKGWKSVYVNEALAYGEGPTTWQDYFNQQMRWAYGCIDVLFRYSPKLLPKMKLKQASYYFFIQQHYFSGLAMIISIFGIALYAALGINTASIDFSRFIMLYLPILAIMGAMSFWMQTYAIRPQEEKGFHFAGKIVSLASWPIFFLAFVGVLRNKRLTYKVTPKGQATNAGSSEQLSFGIFKTHLIIGVICLSSFATALIFNHHSLVMNGWMLFSATLMLGLPFVLVAEKATVLTNLMAKKYVSTFGQRYQAMELDAPDNEWLPSPVTEEEKYSYLHRRHRSYITFSVLSVIAIIIGMMHVLNRDIVMWPAWLYFFITLDYFLVSFISNVATEDFDFETHQTMVQEWHPTTYPSVDIFLPIAGERLDVLRNTWEGVAELNANYKGHATVYCLDDGNSSEAKELALEFAFKYIVRPHREEFKKAGNLQYGLRVSTGQFITIFDADFRPRSDFLDELLPHFYQDQAVGIVQSPQFFDVHPDQNWLERGAGAVQELFYRYTQVTRQHYQAAICVGSNAIYSRQALITGGGFAQINHSEDVHTGFNIQKQGWELVYVPIILAKGLCPANLTTFFKQQYRWCLGSLSLISSSKFWLAKLPSRNRLSHYSGFMYYLHTAVSALFLPFIPIVILLNFPEQITWTNYLYALPSLLLLQVFYPLWHDSTYGMEAWSVRLISGWAHLFAMIDSVLGKTKQWMPSGSKASSDTSYTLFRILQVAFNFIPATFWVLLAIDRLFVVSRPLVLIPTLVSGLYFWLITAKITFYSATPATRTLSHTKRSIPSSVLRYFVEVV